MAKLSDFSNNRNFESQVMTPQPMLIYGEVVIIPFGKSRTIIVSGQGVTKPTGIQCLQR